LSCERRSDLAIKTLIGEVRAEIVQHVLLGPPQDCLVKADEAERDCITARRLDGCVDERGDRDLRHQQKFERAGKATVVACADDLKRLLYITRRPWRCETDGPEGFGLAVGARPVPA
jgi:hypothetical protein